jgi:hypothetical protein
MTMVTLAQLNETPKQREWSGMTLERFYAVGKNGHARSGAKFHLVIGELVIADTDPRPGRYKVGATFSAYSPCNGNGQQVSQPLRGGGLDTSDVTCEKCLKVLAQMVVR